MSTDRLLRYLSIGANLAVLAGLIFVGLEVRDGRAAAVSQVADGIADGFLQLNMAGISDPEVACIWVVGLDRPEALSTVQAARFSLYMRGVFNQYQRVHRQNQTGLVAPDQWEEIAGEALGMMATAGGSLYVRDNPLPQDFLDDLPETGTDMSVTAFTLGHPAPESCEAYVSR